MPEDHIEEAYKNARSFPDRERRGVYIGEKIIRGQGFYFYKDGEKYFYETDFDREMRKTEKNLKRRRWEKDV